MFKTALRNFKRTLQMFKSILKNLQEHSAKLLERSANVTEASAKLTDTVFLLFLFSGVSDDFEKFFGAFGNDFGTFFANRAKINQFAADTDGFRAGSDKICRRIERNTAGRNQTDLRQRRFDRL